jgi:hypothetical protein
MKKSQKRITKEEKACELADARAKAFKNVQNVAIEVLTHRMAYPYGYISDAFRKLENATAAADKHLRRAIPESYSLLHVLFTHKTITDVYWRLSPEVKDLWDAVPELKAWREKYR